MSGSDTLTAPSPARWPGRLELSSPIRSLELTVVTSDFVPVASGVGQLSAEVPAGIYEIVMRAGPIEERRLVRVGAGEVRHLTDLTVAFPSAAPISGTTTSHEPHQQLAEQASRSLHGSPTRSGLVLMVRDARASAGPPLDGADLAGVMLLDGSLRPLPDIAQGWLIDGVQAAATWAGALAPGGYILRVGPAGVPTTSGRPEAAETIDRSVILRSGWQTLVFLPTGETGPRADRLSVHMTQMGMDWLPQDRDIGLALELALWGLRQGRSAVPDDLLNLLLGSKFVNPMLGIVGALALAMRPDLPAGSLDHIVDNLERLVGDHPDVVALRYLAAEIGLTAKPPASPTIRPPMAPVTWPPMLLESYRALIRADARDPGAIADGSIAEHAAAQIVQDVWTGWRPLDLARLAGLPPPAAAGGEADHRGVLAAVARDPGSVRSLRVADPATARVVAYLDAVTQLEGPAHARGRFLSMSPAQIGLATTLPSASVDRALATVGAALTAPSGGGGGGGGWLRAPIVLMAAAAILLVGGGAAFALGLFDDRVDPTPGPTTPPTAAPATPRVPPRILVSLEPDETPAEATATPTATPQPTPSPSPSPSPTPTVEPTTPAPIGLLFDPPSIAFGSVFVGLDAQPIALVVTHGGGRPVAISDLTVTNRDEFSVSADCPDGPLGPGMSCIFVVGFRPIAIGERSGALTLFTAEGGLHNVLLSGFGFVEFVGEPDVIQSPGPVLEDPDPQTPSPQPVD